jgi:hypothetical protein
LLAGSLLELIASLEVLPTEFLVSHLQGTVLQLLHQLLVGAAPPQPPVSVFALLAVSFFVIAILHTRLLSATSYNRGRFSLSLCRGHGCHKTLH